MDNKKRRWTTAVALSAFAVVVTIVSYILKLNRMPGMHFAFYLVAALSFLLIVYLVLWALGSNERYKRASKLLRRCYLICLAMGILAFLVLEVMIITGSHSDDAPVDCVIVLGAGLTGETPQPILISRLEAAIEFLEMHSDIPVIVSGGQGPGETITEAEAMFRYLIARGIGEERIWKEGKSTSTRENMEFSRDLMEKMGFDIETTTVAVVTNEFHLFRAKQIAGRFRIDASGVAAKTPGLKLRALYFCREAFGLAVMYLFDM